MYVAMRKMRARTILFLLYPLSFISINPFSPLSKHEIIICLSLIDRTARFRFVDRFSFEFTTDRSCLYITHAAGTNQLVSTKEAAQCFKKCLSWMESQNDVDAVQFIQLRRMMDFAMRSTYKSL